MSVALPSLRQLRYLVALGQHLNFTRAAEASFVSQSTLSSGLKELEDTLGLKLVERNRQMVALTPEGLEILERSKGLLAAAEDLTQFASDTSKPMTGLIRLGVIPTIAPFLLPIMMPRIRELFPALRLALREDLTHNLLSRLRDRQLDFAIIALPFDTEGLMVNELFQDEFWLAARSDEFNFKGKHVSLPTKMAERLLLLEEGHCLREHSLKACGRSEIASADGIEATSLLTLVQMVESGMGVALLPEMAIKSGLLNNTNLSAKPLTESSPKRVIALVARDSNVRIDEFNALARAIKETHNQEARKNK